MFLNPLKLLIYIFSFYLLIQILFLFNNFFEKNKFLKEYFLTMMITLQFFGINLWINFDPFLLPTEYNRGYQFFFTIDINPLLNFNLSFGLDGIALIFILLTLFIFSLCFFIIQNFIHFKKSFFFTLFVLEFILILVFSVLDLFFFYICFEGSLIPMFFIIGFWGSRSRKIKASFYLFLYTMTTALLMLIGIFYLFLQVGSTFYMDLLNYNFDKTEQFFLWIFFFLTFATKIPIIPFHLWLPEAHVEAPTVGSIILASILLKIGGFGFIRYIIPIFPYANFFFLPFIFSIGICSVIYASMITIRQIDLKRIIAYSSIAHMNMVVSGIFTNNIYGIEGAIFLMIGHAIISSALFFLIGVIYDRYHTRLLRYYNGLITVMPICGTFLFFFILGNIGFPGTSNFIGEFLILIGIFYKNPFIAFFTGFGIILSAIYSFWFFNRLFFGTLKNFYTTVFFDITKNEFYVLSILFFLMFYFGFSSNNLLNICLLNLEHILLTSVI